MNCFLFHLNLEEIPLSLLLKSSIRIRYEKFIWAIMNMLNNFYSLCTKL